MTTNVLPVVFIDVNPVGAAAALQVDGHMGADLRFDTGQDRHKAQLQTGFQQRGLVFFVDVRGFVQVVRQADTPGLITVHQVQQQIHVGQRLDGHGRTVGRGTVDIGMDHRLTIELGDLERQLEQVLEAQLVMIGCHQPRQVFLGLFVLVVLLGALAEVEHRQGFAFFVLAGAMDYLVDMLEGLLVRRQYDTEALEVGYLTFVDLAVEQRQLMLKAVVVAADIAQRTGDIGDGRAARLAQGQGFFGAVGVGVDQQLQAPLHIVFTVELGHALEAHLRVQCLDLTVATQQALPTVLIVVEQWQQVVHRVVDRVHKWRAKGQVGWQQLASTQAVIKGALLGFHIANLSAYQLQLGRQLLDALGKGITGTLQLVLRGFGLGQLFELFAFFSAQCLATAEIFQGLLRIQHLLIQGLGFALARSAIRGHGLLGFQLLEFFFQTLFLLAQGCAVGQGLQGRRLDMAEVDGQARRFKTLAFKAVEDQLQRLDPGVAVIQRNPVLTQGQAEQGAVE